jgi:uncharacterized repeat protein (TIGR01451 family)
MVLPGDVINYTLHLVNTGNLTATNIVVTDPLPTLTAFESFHPSALIFHPGAYKGWGRE